MSFLKAYRLWLRVKNRLFTQVVKNSFASFGKGSLIQSPSSIWGEAAIEIGAGVHIGANTWIHALERSGNESLVVISIGDGCVFSGDLTISATLSVTIEEDVIIGRGVHISDHSHQFERVDLPIHLQGVTPAKRVTICQGAWIGQGVIICPGVTIGKNSVVGGNSVVRLDVPDFSVVAGVPAKFIRAVSKNAIHSDLRC